MNMENAKWFVNKSVAVGKDALQYSKDKAVQGYQYLNEVPEDIDCVGCGENVQVPRSTFDWACSSCTAVNEVDSYEKCAVCQTQRVHDPDKVYQVICLNCEVENSVPISNARLLASNAASKTKELAHQGAQLAKEQYERQRSVPDLFHCAHCAARIENPNVGEQVMDEKEERVERVMCPLCRKETKVPQEVWVDGLTAFSQVVKKGAVTAYYTVSKECYVKCPNCAYPVKVKDDEDEDDFDEALLRAETGETEQLTVICTRCEVPFEAVH